MNLLGDMDPWDWSVDQVVEALCQNVTWWQDAVPGMVLPEAGSLESALRENETNGFTLLTYVDDHILKSDFGLKAVARRAAMRWAIGFLRDRSAKYSQQLSGKQPVAQGESLAEHKISKASTQPNGTDIPTPPPSTGVATPGQAGETFIVDKQGRKRRKLVLGAANQKSHDVTKFDFSKKLTADHVFYGATPFGEVLKEDDDYAISQTSNPHPIAAEYVYRHLVHFTGNPKRERLVRGNCQAMVIYPYKDGSQPADQPRSVTLFTVNAGEAQATREDASVIEIEARQSRQTNTQGKTIGEDEILPLYGESDSEGDDEASLRDEMEADRREDEALGISKHTPLTREVVSSTIESRVQEFVELWQAKKLPLRERTARTIWRKAKRRSDRILFVVDAQGIISHITRRLEKLKEALLADPWYFLDNIRKQCVVLEESVFQIQEQQFRISVWERATEPPAMPRATTKTRAPRAQRKTPVSRNDDDAGDLVNSESDLEAGSDGLGSFIVDEEMPDYNNSDPQRLASSHRHTPAGDSGLCVGDDDVSMGDADDAMHDDAPAEPNSRTELSRHSTVNSERTGSAQSNTTASETEASKVIDLSRMSISRSNSPAKGPPVNQFTSLTDDALAALPSHEIRTWDMAQLEECMDRRRLIVRIVRTRISDDRVDKMKNDEFMVDVDQWQNLASATTPVLSNEWFHELKIPKKKSGILQSYLKLYLCWLKARASFWDEDAFEVAGKELPPPLDKRSLGTFWKFFRRVIHSAPTSFRPEMISSRKRVVQTSAVGREMRESALERQEVQAKKVRLFEERMTSLPPDSTHRVIINIGKAEGEGDIFVHPHIAPKIKPHQINGVRFIWREVIEAEQGCLLAHTMGLGKTMQAITFLVAMTEAANSEDFSVSSQIPDRLETARYLIICPASLITNWNNELRQWIPPSVAQRMGEIRSVESDRRNLAQRMNSIHAWYKSGGIMLMGYEMLNSLVQPTTSTPLTEEFRKWLLEGPTLIIADEAHRFKSAHSKTRQVFEQFSSPHRIALTGSPLANSLEEYWSMIDWVAPGYLGEATEFKAYFVEPIQEGLYKDSSWRDHRRALKCLTVLKREIEPKVNRADITVLKDELKSKVEFLITIPLSDLQEKAYKLCVSHMLPDTSQDVSLPTMWNWIHILSVLCNHPLAFLKRIRERAEVSDAPRKKAKKVSLEDEAEVEEEIGLQNPGLSPALIAGIEELFDQVPHVESPVWSYKTEVLVHIIQRAKLAGDRVLVFSQSIPTLDYLQKFFATNQNFRCMRLDGSTKMSERPKLLGDFNKGTYDAFLMSTKAGGIGFNIPAANRVVLFDSGFNPQHEEQAIGRAYRIGQQKEVYVYRLCVGGTFEPKVWNKALFKAQLASRVVDAKKPERQAEKYREYLFPPTPVEQQDVSENRGKDPKVLDKLLEDMERGKDIGIRAITTTETLMAEDKEGDLDLDEMEEVESMMKKDGGGRATDPATFGRRREAEEQARLTEQARLAQQAMLLEESRHRQQLVKENQRRQQPMTAGQPRPNYPQPRPNYPQPRMFTSSAPQGSIQARPNNPQPGMFTSTAPQGLIQAHPNYPQPGTFTSSALQGSIEPQVAQYGMDTVPTFQAAPFPPFNAEQLAERWHAMSGVNSQGPTTASRSHVASSGGYVEPIHSPDYDNVHLPDPNSLHYPFLHSSSDYATSRRVRSQEPQPQYVAEQTRRERYASLPLQGEQDTRLGFTNGCIEQDYPDSGAYSGDIMRTCFGERAGAQTVPFGQHLQRRQSSTPSRYGYDADDVEMQPPHNPTTEPDVDEEL